MARLLQVPCKADHDFYGGNIVLHVDAYKQDGSWLRLQPIQVAQSLSGISVQTSVEAVVQTLLSAPLSTHLIHASELCYV